MRRPTTNVCSGLMLGSGAPAIATAMTPPRRRLHHAHPLDARCVRRRLLELGALLVREKVVRPLQTIANLLAALREGDFSIRARRLPPDDPLGGVHAEINSSIRPARATPRRHGGHRPPAHRHGRDRRRHLRLRRFRSPPSHQPLRRNSSPSPPNASLAVAPPILASASAWTAKPPACSRSPSRRYSCWLCCTHSERTRLPHL